MTRPNAVYFHPNRYAIIARSCEFGSGELIETRQLNHGCYVRVDDHEARGPQLCDGAEMYGDTIIYQNEQQMARRCRARIYKTRSGFDRAAARIVND